MSVPAYPRYYIPDGTTSAAAFRRTRSLVIAAHADDIEIFGFEAVLRGLGIPGGDPEPVTGVVVTDGVGSPRGGSYRTVGSDWMRRLREREQERAARLGRYNAVVFLGYPSGLVKRQPAPAVDDLATLLEQCRPARVYTHNLADRHDTHVAVALCVIEAARRVPRRARPRQLLGCEVWRDLDWLTGSERVEMDVSGHDALARRLIGCFRSQIGSGKDYVRATLGRRHAHATFSESHHTDRAESLILAMDMTPLVLPGGPTPDAFIAKVIARFADDVAGRIRQISAGRR